MLRRTNSICLIMVLVLLSGMSDSSAATKTLVRGLDELLEWVARLADDADETASATAKALAPTLNRLKSSGVEVTEPLAQYLFQRARGLPPQVLGDDALMRLLSREPQMLDSAFAAAKRVNHPDFGRCANLLVNQKPECARQVFAAIAGEMDGDAVTLLLRSLSGRTVSEKQLLSAIDACRGGAGIGTAADVFEVIARQQLAAGAMKGRLPLKQGSGVIDGRYNAIHGIDGIGVDASGVPVIFEFTIDKRKNLAATGQLSHDWNLSRWNRMIKNRPEVIEELKQLGVADRFIGVVDSATVKQMHRKLIANTDNCLSESNRLAVGLKAEDLLVLGR